MQNESTDSIDFNNYKKQALYCIFMCNVPLAELNVKN